MDNEEEHISTERTPLIQNADHVGRSPAESSRRPIIAVAPVNPDEQPVPMAPSAMSAVGGVPTINCRICKSLISLEGKLGNHVVKCPSCNEATPIRPAPDSKRYVRCPCGCLLVCKQAASRISCPRDHCRRVLNLNAQLAASGSINSMPEYGSATDNSQTNSSSGYVVYHLQCPSCCLSFLLQSDPSSPWATCPHCSARAVLHRSYLRRRWVALLVLAVMFTACGVGCLIGTWKATFENGTYGLIAAWGTLFVLAAAALLAAICVGSIRVAKVMTSATSHGRFSYA